MEQQVIRELIELIGGIHIDFATPITVKMSPHSIPSKVTAARYDHNGVYLVVDREEKKWSDVGTEVRNSVVQRLRLIVHQKSII